MTRSLAREEYLLTRSCHASQGLHVSNLASCTCSNRRSMDCFMDNMMLSCMACSAGVQETMPMQLMTETSLSPLCVALLKGQSPPRGFGSIRSCTMPLQLLSDKQDETVCAGSKWILERPIVMLSVVDKWNCLSNSEPECCNQTSHTSALRRGIDSIQPLGTRPGCRLWR